ncbi:MAG: YihY/virulence factor BrkB family protein [Anaerovoracaceae bacterium]
MKKIKEMTRERVKRMVILGFQKLSDPYYQGAAAEIAFYFLLSIVPTLILLSQLLGLFSISLDGIRDWLNTDMIQVEGADMILSLLDYSPSGVNSVFLAVTAVWAASRAQFAMLRITNYTLTDGISTGKGYVRDRIRSLKTVVITVFTIGFSLVILVYGELILKLVFGIVVGSEIAEKTWVMIRWPIAAGLYFLMISYNYYVLPTHRVPYRAVVPGSIFASIGLMVVTWVYSIYTSVSSGYDILYGSFSNFVALMFWFYLLSWVLFLGVILNKVWWDSRFIPEE